MSIFIPQEVLDKIEGVKLSTDYMSVRLFNCMRHAGYEYLSEIIELDDDDVVKIRNFGKQSLEEFQGLKAFILTADENEINKYCKSGSQDVDFDKNCNIVSLVKKFNVGENDFFCTDNNGSLVADYPLPIEIMSVRAYNSLRREGIDTIKKLALISVDELHKIHGMGAKAFDEIYEFIDKRTVAGEGATNTVSNIEEVDSTVDMLVSYFKDCIEDISTEAARVALFNELSRNYIVDNSLVKINRTILGELVHKQPIIGMIKNKIYDLAADSVIDEVQISYIYSKLDRINHFGSDVIDSIIEEMINEKRVILIGELICKYRKSINEWIVELKDNERRAIQLRCEGATLEEVGKVLSVTRERARQIIAKGFRKKPVLLEDGYSDIFEKYSFRDEEFCGLFGVDNITVTYLNNFYKKGSGDIYDFIMDESIPKKFVRNIPQAFRDSFLIVDDGVVLPLKREKILEWILKKYYSDIECTIPELEEFYNEFLDSKNLINNEKLLFSTSHAFEARILDYSCVVLKYGKKIRYFDIDMVNVDELLEQVDIYQYNNSEISTLKIFVENSELMDQLGIWDEYELHNIFRKKQEHIRKYNISVERMPFITIGSGDRERQVRDLLYQLAPISNYDLAMEYEVRYGVKKETVLANFFKEIDIYYHDGMYDVEQSQLTDSEIKVLEAVLVDDFYMWGEVVDIFSKNILNGNHDVINAMNLKRLGFRVYSQYIIKNNFSSADSYFSYLLLKEDTINLDELKVGMRSIQSFHSCLNGYRDALDLIEVDRNVFMKFECFVKKVIPCTKEDLIVTGRNMVEGYQENIFTIMDDETSKRLNKYSEIINNIYFINSILRIQKNIRTTLFSDFCLVTKDGREPNQQEIYIELLRKYGAMSFDEIIEKAMVDFGLKTYKSKVAYFLEQSEIVEVDTLMDVARLVNVDGKENSSFWVDTPYENLVRDKMHIINKSNDTIEESYNNDYYKSFMNLCKTYSLIYMRELLEFEMEAECIQANISKPIISDIISIYFDWIKNLNAKTEETEDILSMFFK